jgi:hypothetical protein
MSLKENLQVQTGGVVVGVQEGAFSLKQWYLNLYQWQKVLLIILFVTMIPGVVIVRYGVELVLLRQYGQEALVAHPAFNDPDQLSVSKVNIITNPNGTLSAYAIVKNPNLDLGADDLGYTFNFMDSSGAIVYTTSGSTYLLPDQQRWIVVPRVDSQASITKAELKFEDPVWQKKLNLPEVELRMNEPYSYQQDSPLATITEGSVINNSPYGLRQVSLVLVLYGAGNEVIGVTSREEFTLKPYERRAYIVQWPGIARAEVTRLGLEAYTNTLDPTNLSIDTSQ